MRKAAIAITVILLAAGSFVGATASGFTDLKMDALLGPAPVRWGRDPFLRYDDRTKRYNAAWDVPSLRIKGIISNGGGALAIINDSFFRKGDTVMGYRILDIKGDRVVLEKDGRKIPLGIDRFTISAGQEDK